MRNLVALPSLNLSSLRARTRKAKKWGAKRISTTETEYLRFLALCRAYPDQKICPSPDVDEMWHLHILDTKQYAEDCNSYFGYFLHHEPCLNGNEDEVKEKTVELYQQLFGSAGTLYAGKSTTCAGPGDGCGSRVQQPSA